MIWLILASAKSIMTDCKLVIKEIISIALHLRYILKSVATWSFLERPVWSFLPVSPIFEMRIVSMFMWTSSYSFLVVDRFPFKGRQVVIKERIFGLAADHRTIPFVKFEADRPADIFLGRIDESIERLFERRKPLAVINQFGVTFRDQFFVMRRIAV